MAKTNAQILAEIAANIKQNGRKAITGDILGGIMKDVQDFSNEHESWADVSSKLYYNTQAGNVAAKTIQASGFTLQPGGCLKIHFDNKNTADNPTLNVNGTGAHQMSYKGALVDATNTWASGEVVMAYYDAYGVGLWRLVSLTDAQALVNVNDAIHSTDAFASAAAARAAVPTGLRKPGLQITYLLAAGWMSDQFIGDNVTDWSVADNWKVIGPVSVSQNTLTIGGEYAGEVSTTYDVTLHNSGATFASLSALLSDADLATLIPTNVRKGGMTIKFVQSSDNKYVQYRLMANAWSTTPSDWQGVDEEPVAGSKNLVESGGVSKPINKNKVDILSQVGSIIGGDIFPEFNTDIWESGTIDSSGNNTPATNRLRTIDFLRIKKNCTINKINVDGYGFNIVFYNENKECIGETNYSNRENYNTGEASYIRIVFRKYNDSTISVDDAVGHECSFVVNYISTEDEIISHITQNLGGETYKTISQKGVTENLNKIDGTLFDLFAISTWHQGSYYEEVNPVNSRKYCIVSCLLGDSFVFSISSSSWFVYIQFADGIGTIGRETKIDESCVVNIEQDANGRYPTEIRVTAIHVPDTTITDELWKTFDITCYKDGKIQKINNIIEDISYNKSIVEEVLTLTWNLGEVNRYGKIVPNESGYYYYSSPVTLKSGDRVSIDTDGQGFTPICLYLGDTPSSSWVIDKITVGTNTGIKHYELTAPFDCTLVLCRKGDAEIHKYVTVIDYSALNSLIKVNVASWNFGFLNNGVTPKGIPNAELATTLPKVKSLLASLNADILFATEIPLKVDRDGTLDLYATLLKQFYPYYSEVITSDTTPMALYSKYPINVSKFTATSGRNFILGYAVINGRKVGVGVIHNVPDSDAGSTRETDDQNVIDYFDSFSQVVIGGDFNTYSDDELDVFRNAGWVLGNCGYFGNIDTYKPSSREWYIDNIVTKGINIDTFGKIDDRADVSDHYPVCSKVSFFSN